MGSNTPCKGCVPPKRTGICHSTCKEYKIWKAKLQAVKENEKAVKESQWGYIFRK